MGDLFGLAISAAFSRLLAPRPSIKKVNNRLVIASTWRTSLLTLGAVSRAVTIDPQDKLLRISHRTCWAFRRERWIRFNEISEIVYSYQDLAGSSWFSHTSQDLFVVGFWLHSGEVVPLFRFYGEGEFINNSIWPDWLRWDDFLAAQITRGSQDGESRLLTDVLSGLIGVPVGSGPLY